MSLGDDPKQPQAPVSRITRDAAQALQVAPWNKIAPLRAQDLDSGRDLSFDNVIAPTISKWAMETKGPILDVGCGTGRLTRRLANFSRRVVGVDPSTVSADMAHVFCRGLKHVDVYSKGIEDFAQSSVEKFDTVVLSMVLQDVVDLDSVLKASASVLRPGGRMLIAVTHPYFWPKYWGYSRAKWFDYSRETFLRTEFRTSLTRSGIETMHCHRPLEQYFASLRALGILVKEVREPLLPTAVQRSSGVHWREPHFLFISAARRK